LRPRRARERAGENDAIEADVLAKTTIAESKQSAFKKTPDVPLRIVVKRKLAKREELPQSKTSDTAHVYPDSIFAIELTPTLGAQTRKIPNLFARMNAGRQQGGGKQYFGTLSW
jgi:hypothetical protein